MAASGRRGGDGQHFARERLSSSHQTLLVYRHGEKTARGALYSASLIKSAEIDGVGMHPAHASLPSPRPGDRTRGLGKRSDISP